MRKMGNLEVGCTHAVVLSYGKKEDAAERLRTYVQRFRTEEILGINEGNKNEKFRNKRFLENC